MKESIIQILNYDNIKKIIIFLSVSSLAIYALVYISLYSVNIPFSDDWPTVFAALYYQQHDPTWIKAILGGGNEHLLYFYRLVMMVGLSLNSYNIQQFNYLNWAFLSSSVGILYVVLKSDRRLTWLIIPISAFVYNPTILNFNLIASYGIIWSGTFFFLVSVVGILNKQKLTKFWLVIAICLSVVATTNGALGLLTWIVGIFFLIRQFNKKRKYFLLWLVVSVITFYIYLSIVNIDHAKNQLNTVLNISGIYYALEYIANPFSVHSVELQHLIGFVSLVSLISISGYFLIKRINVSYPWIIVGSIGILSAMLTAEGRFSVRPPTTNYFIIMSSFTQIALLVVISILFLETRKSKSTKWRWLSVIIYIFFITSEMIALSISYHDGFQYEITGHKALIPYLDCLEISVNPLHCKFFNVFGDPKNNWEYSEDVSPVFNMLLEIKTSIFSNVLLEQEKKSVDLEKKWNILEQGRGMGDIDYVNDHKLARNETVLLNDSSVRISGWAMGINGNVDKIILFVDRKPLLSTDRFWQRPEVVQEYDLKYKNSAIGWGTLFFSGLIKNGCHKISIGGIDGNVKFYVDKEFILCKKPTIL